MISPESREPFSRARKISLVILLIAALVVAWLMAATIKLSTMSTVNADSTPDKVATVSLVAYAAEQLGFENGTPVPLSKQFAEEPTGKLELGISKVYRDAIDKKRVVVLEARLGDARGFTSYLEDTTVKWDTGDTPSVKFTFNTNVDVRLLYLGKGYGVWRFLTFRGSESYDYMPEVNSDRVEHDTLSEILANVTSITITVPNTPEWQKLKAPIN